MYTYISLGSRVALPKGKMKPNHKSHQRSYQDSCLRKKAWYPESPTSLIREYTLDDTARIPSVSIFPDEAILDFLGMSLHVALTAERQRIVA